MNKCLRWTIGCTLAITMAAGLAGCGSSAGSGSSTGTAGSSAAAASDSTAASEAASSTSSSAHSDDDTLNVVDAEWYGIDSYQLDSSATLQQCVGESLFEWDTEKNDITDGVCTDWKVSDDGKTVTFNVPEGMYYSTGEEVEPEDVVASIQHGQEVSPYSDAYANIESMDVDGRQVTLHLTGYRSDMLYAFCADFMTVIDKDELDSMSNDELMWGCHPYGMYSVEQYVSGSEVKLTRNDGYVTHCPKFENQGPAHFKNIDVTFNVEEFTAVESLKSGDVDFIATSLSQDSVKDLSDESNVSVVEASYPEIDYIELQTDKGPMADKDVRLGICLLIDRQALCDMSDGQAVPAYSMIFDTMQNFSQDAKDYFMQNYADDPDRGIQLIEGAGYTKNSDGYYGKDGNVLSLELYADSGDLSSLMAEGLQGQLDEYGVQVNFNPIDWNYVHEQAKNDDYDMARQSLGWAEPILIFNACYHDPTAPTPTDEYYAKVDDIAATVDSDERTQKIGDLQKEMYDNLDNIPFYSPISYIAYNKDLQGVNIQSDGSWSWNDVTW